MGRPPPVRTRRTASCIAPPPTAMRPRSLVNSSLSAAITPGPRISRVPRWETSNSPTVVRTAACSARTRRTQPASANRRRVRIWRLQRRAACNGDWARCVRSWRRRYQPGPLGRRPAASDRLPIMIRLLRRYLAPYRGPILIVMGLLFVQAIGNLFLPTLNADIINKGVVTGDIGYIVRVGLVMLGVTLALGICSVIAVYYSARTAMAFGRDVPRQPVSHRREFLAAGSRSLRYAVADHPQHQRRAAGADVGVHGHDDARDRAADRDRRRHHGAESGRATVGAVAGGGARDGGGHRVDAAARGAAVPRHAGAHRPHQRSAAREVGGCAGDPCLRADPGGGGPLRSRQRRADRHLASGHPTVRPDDAGVDADR